MKRIPGITAVAVLALGLSTLALTDVAQAQRQPQPRATETPTPRQERGTQQQPPQQSPQQQQPQQQTRGAGAIASVVDTSIANSSILNQALNDDRILDRLLTQRGMSGSQRNPPPGGQRGAQASEQQISVMYLDDMVAGGEMGMLNQLLNNSNALSRNAVIARTVASNSQQIQNFMERNNIARNRLVSLDVIGEPVTLWVTGTRQGTDNQQNQRQENQDTQPGRRGQPRDQDTAPGRTGEQQDQNVGPRTSPTPRPRG